MIGTLAAIRVECTIKRAQHTDRHLEVLCMELRDCEALKSAQSRSNIHIRGEQYTITVHGNVCTDPILVPALAAQWGTVTPVWAAWVIQYMRIPPRAT